MSYEGAVRGAAVIGCGLIGARAQAQALERCRIPVRSIFDAVPERAAALVGSLPSAVVGVSAADACSRDGVDLAVIATTHVALVPASLEALAAGCHVLVEKPGARVVREAVTLQAQSRASGRAVRVGFNHRFHPALRKARQIVGGGRHGPVMGIRARYGHGGRLGYEREWRADRALSGGGELLDQGVHLIDLTRFLVGDVDLAFSELRTDYWDMDVEDNAYLALRARAGAHGGAFAWLHASWTEWKNLFSFEVTMRSAKIEIDGLGGSYGVERLTLHELLPELGPPMTRAWEWPREDASWVAEVEDVLSGIGGGPSIGASIDDAVAALTVVDEAYRR